MIVAQLFSGMGNQMFQYASARCLADLKNTGIKIDISSFENDKLRTFDLDCFDISASKISKNELKIFSKNENTFLNKLFFKFDNRKPYFKRRTYIEKAFEYDQNFFLANKNTILSGYWQSEKYFLQCRDLILKEFSFLRKLNDKYIEIQNIIQNSVSVSIHVRRGDYVQNPDTNKVHGLCDSAYYEKSIEYFEKLNKNTTFFVFSDEPEWCKENIKSSSDIVFVSGGKNYEDLQLMSLCKNNIIANSSFSWWGAWLNTNPEKIVIAPKIWFADTKKNNQTNDLIPEKWLRF